MSGPEPYWSDGQVSLFLGDCRNVLAEMDDASVDAVVTDPPYDLTAGKKGGSGEASVNLNSPQGRARVTAGGFMNKSWDATGVAFDPETWRAVLRVLKPGGFVLAFGGSRTSHRMTCAIEDAGFEIRDPIADLTGIDGPGLLWVYSQGMPKSRNVAKDIDRMLGATPEVIAEGAPLKRMIPGADQNRTGSWIKDNGREFVPTVTRPATPEAARWEGWGTALKPAWEIIVVARKPIAGTVAQNVLAHGTGALNLGACKLPPSGESRPRDGEASQETRYADRGATDFAALPGTRGGDPAGRWPPNLVIGEAAAAELDRGADSGGVSRFFPVFKYQGKATTAERPQLDDGTTWATVKPLPLIRWLVRLVTPPGGTVLDLFAGTGTTGEACIIEGFQCVLIDKEPPAIALIRERLSKDIQPDMFGGAA